MGALRKLGKHLVTYKFDTLTLLLRVREKGGGGRGGRGMKDRGGGGERRVWRAGEGV